MTKSVKLIIGIGLCVSLICSSLIVIMALDHNPQGEYTNNIWSLFSLALTASCFVMLPFTVLAVMIKAYACCTRRDVPKARTTFYLLLLGLVGGICLAGWSFLFRDSYFTLGSLYMFVAMISYPFTILAFIVSLFAGHMTKLHIDT